MEITFLGTSSMMPTKARNHSAVFVQDGTEGILIDCGEGTQRQMKIAGVKHSKVTKILISHWHGDHTLGLPGLLQSMSASEYEGTLEIFGPPETKKRFKSMFETFVFDKKIKIKITEIKNGVVAKSDRLIVKAQKLNHVVTCFGYSITQQDKRRIKLAAVKKAGIPQGPLLGQLQAGKTVTHKDQKFAAKDLTTIVEGKKLTIIPDTAMCTGAVAIAKDADLVISEATYLSTLKDKAKEHAHLTAQDAATIAKKARAKQLILTHFSARYKDTSDLKKDAQKIFKKVSCAKDFLKVAL